MKVYNPPIVKLTAIQESIPMGLRSLYNGQQQNQRFPFLQKTDPWGKQTGNWYVNVSTLVDWGAARGKKITLPDFISVTER